MEQTIGNCYISLSCITNCKFWNILSIVMSSNFWRPNRNNNSYWVFKECFNTLCFAFYGTLAMTISLDFYNQFIRKKIFYRVRNRVTQRSLDKCVLSRQCQYKSIDADCDHGPKYFPTSMVSPLLYFQALYFPWYFMNS